MLGDGDTGWHIRTGEWILANGRVPHQDMFSFTKAGAAVVCLGMAVGRDFAWLHNTAGMAAVVLASLLVICADLGAAVPAGARGKCGNALMAIAVMVLVTAARPSTGWRGPHLFTLLFMVIFYSMLERVKEGQRRGCCGCCRR